jgi:hypothetical protein
LINYATEPNLPDWTQLLFSRRTYLSTSNSLPNPAAAPKIPLDASKCYAMLRLLVTTGMPSLCSSLWTTGAERIAEETIGWKRAIAAASGAW